VMRFVFFEYRNKVGAQWLLGLSDFLERENI
jgi:hypothetical protein